MRRIYWGAFTALAMISSVVSQASVARADFLAMNLDAGASNVTLQLTLDGADVLIPALVQIPLTHGGLTLDLAVDGGGNPSSISNISGLKTDGLGLFVQDPWDLETQLGALSLAGGHLSVGVGGGPYAVSGNDVDLSGLAVSLDGGAGSLLGGLFTFDFSTGPVNFTLPGGSIATLTQSGLHYNLDIPVFAEDSTILDDLGGAVLTYRIEGNIAFTTVPEPGTFALLGMGVFGVVARRNRRAIA